MPKDRRNNQHIVISRTDGIGDVILTLPIAGVLKRHFPSCKVSFLGRAYTEAVVSHCEHVDTFISWDEISAHSSKDQVRDLENLDADVFIHVFPVKEIARLAKKAEIPTRIGTSHRVYHINTCNKLINLGRKNSNLHEAQLNIKLLAPMDIKGELSKTDIPGYYGFRSTGPLSTDAKSALDDSRFNLIIHPRSKGSAREWGIDNFVQLLKLLPKDKFNVILTGTKEEGAAIRGTLFSENPELTDLSGRLDLQELITLIGHADGLLAASTGPLHIASALGKHAIGVFAPMRPIDPGRWAPLGSQAKYFVLDKKCGDCKNEAKCACIAAIPPREVLSHLLKCADE